MATKWEPLEDGDINTWISVENGGRHIGVYVDDDRYAEEDLPEGYAVCRLVTDDTPALPVPSEVRNTIEKALAYWYRASADLIFLAEDREVELGRIDSATEWLDTLTGGDGDVE